MKIPLPTFSVRYSRLGFSVPTTAFSINMIKVSEFKFYLSHRTSGVGSSVVPKLLSVVPGSRAILNVHPCGDGNFKKLLLLQFYLMSVKLYEDIGYHGGYRLLLFFWNQAGFKTFLAL